MLFQHILRYLWWFQLYCRRSKMVDYQKNLDQWLEDATFFSFEPVDYNFNLDEFITDGKANNRVDEGPLGLSGLEWLDEKVDLSVFDSNSLLTHPNETETLMVDAEANLLLELADSNPDASYLSSDVSKNEKNDFFKDFSIQNFQADEASSEIFNSHLASPGCTSLQINSPNFASPVYSPFNSSDVGDIPLESIQSSPAYSQQDSASSSSIPVDGSADSNQEVLNTVCNQINNDPPENAFLFEEPVTIEEVSDSIRKRKYVTNGKDIPKIRVTLNTTTHPYGKAASRTKERQERKKVQNKEAAARYRVKKRMEEKELSDEVTTLQSEQKKLKQKHDELVSEIKYLKSLMLEILGKKGILK